MIRDGKSTTLYSEEFMATEASDPKAACGGKAIIFLELIGKRRN